MKLVTTWEYESPGGDTHQSCAWDAGDGIGAAAAERRRPELYVAATNPADYAAVLKKLRDKCDVLQREFVGMSVADLGAEAQVMIPESWRRPTRITSAR